MQKMVVARLVAARGDETCALSSPPSRPARRSPSRTHTNTAPRPPHARPARTPAPAHPSPSAALPRRAPRPPLAWLYPAGAPRAPRSPHALPPGWSRAFPAHHSPTPSSLLPRLAEGPTLGMGTPAPLSPLLQAPPLLRCTWQEIGPAGGVYKTGSGAQGVSGSPGPRPPAAFLQAHGEDRLPPSPTAFALLPASPSSATGLRAGDSGPRCSKDFSPANGPGIWRA